MRPPIERPICPTSSQRLTAGAKWWWSEGGIAGLEAARVSAERGHEVVLFEASDRLGGQIKLAANFVHRQSLQKIVAWRVGELAHHGVDLRLETRADADAVIAERPDVVLIATGGTPRLADFSGTEFAQSVWDGMADATRFAGKDVLIYDGLGRHQAPGCAVHLVRAGARVTFVTIDDRIAEEMGGSERVMHRKRFEQHAIPVHIDLQIAGG